MSAPPLRPIKANSYSSYMHLCVCYGIHDVNFVTSYVCESPDGLSMDTHVHPKKCVIPDCPLYQCMCQASKLDDYFTYRRSVMLISATLIQFLWGRTNNVCFVFFTFSQCSVGYNKGALLLLLLAVATLHSCHHVLYGACVEHVCVSISYCSLTRSPCTSIVWIWICRRGNGKYE